MIYDLTIPINASTPSFPEDEPVQIEQVATVKEDGYNKKRFRFDSHFSTHIDAPLHMKADGKSLSDFTIGSFVGSGIVLDARGKAEIDINLDDVREDDIVFLCTNHIERLHDPHYFIENPVLTERFGHRLVAKKIRIIGLDSFTPDNDPYPVHHILFDSDIRIVENLCNLEPLIGKRCKFTILPLNIENGDGAPCRVIAEVQ